MWRITRKSEAAQHNPYGESTIFSPTICSEKPSTL